MKFKIEVEIDDEQNKVTVRDSRKPGEDKEFQGGVHLVAADGETRVYYILSYGSASDIGWALAQVFKDGWKMPHVRRLFYHFTEWINKFIVNVGDGYEPEELEAVAERWENEDKAKAVDKKRFN